MKKIFTFLIIILLIIISFYFIKIFFDKNIFNIQDKIYNKYPNLQSDFRKHLFEKESVIENLKNDYNYKFLPETQFINLSINSKKFLFSDEFENMHAQKKISGESKGKVDSKPTNQ